MVFSSLSSEDNRLGTDKTTLHSYGPIYERVITDIHTQTPPVSGSILEIGVLSGASVVALSQAFPEREIYGLDIDLGNVVYPEAKTHPRIHLIETDATDPRDIPIPSEDCFALIIDDGSHAAADILAAFVLWGPKVQEGGYYVIEDLTAEVFNTIAGGMEVLGRKWGIQWKVEDLRTVRGRWDDIMLVGHKIKNL